MSRAAWAATLARAFCGITFLIHGTPKILNLASTGDWFASIGLPAWVAVPVALLEFFGGFLLVTGTLTRILAGLFAIEMAVAIAVVHFPNGWDVFHLGDPMARGYEYNVALIVLLAVVLLVGPGPVSVDTTLARRAAAGRPAADR